MKNRQATYKTLRAALAGFGNVAHEVPCKMDAINAITTYGTTRKQRKELESRS